MYYLWLFVLHKQPVIDACFASKKKTEKNVVSEGAASQ